MWWWRQHQPSQQTKELLEELRALNLPPNQFAVFGSGPMAIRGLREMHDVDVIVTGALWRELETKYTPQKHEHNLLKIQISRVEILSGWHPDVGSVKALISNAEWIEGFPFVRLEKVLEWKRKFKRDKDLPDIEILEALPEGKETSKSSLGPPAP